MKFLYSIFLLFFIIHIISSCSQSSDKNIVQDNIKNPELYYSQAMIEFENKNYDLALKYSKI